MQIGDEHETGASFRMYILRFGIDKEKETIDMWAVFRRRAETPRGQFHVLEIVDTISKFC